jgi:predicted metal-binding protein
LNPKYVIIIQCEFAKQRCSGFACTNAFYNKEEMFQDYNATTRYIAFSCGNCSGRGISTKLAHLARKLKAKNGLSPDQTVIHLASCMVTDNHHYDRCPHLDYIKAIIAKKGFPNVVEGSYISPKAKKKREEGIYKNYESRM